jgi:hypothetical protein
MLAQLDARTTHATARKASNCCQTAVAWVSSIRRSQIQAAHTSIIATHVTVYKVTYFPRLHRVGNAAPCTAPCTAPLSCFLLADSYASSMYVCMIIVAQPRPWFARMAQSVTATSSLAALIIDACAVLDKLLLLTSKAKLHALVSKLYSTLQQCAEMVRQHCLQLHVKFFCDIL